MTRPDHSFHKSAVWRDWARKGASLGPGFFVRWAPAVIGLVFALLLPHVRAMVRRNLRRIYGERDAARENWDILRTFSQFAACLTESLGATRGQGYLFARPMAPTEMGGLLAVGASPLPGLAGAPPARSFRDTSAQGRRRTSVRAPSGDRSPHHEVRS